MTIEVGKVGMINIDSIIFEDRAREVLGNLDELEDNMKNSGLISPLAVKDNKDGTYKLLAGGRRFTVLKRNNVSLIPARIYDRDLTELEMKVIEKSENLHRKDLEWWELDKLTAEIHKMQQQLHGAKAPGPNQSGWGTRDTANMIGAKSPASVSESVRRAEAIEAFPDAFLKCKTAHDANKLLKKMDQAVIKQAIAQKLEAQKTNGALQQLSKCFIIKDFFEGVKEIPDGIMNLVEIDPPYAISLLDNKKISGESIYNKPDYNEIDKEDYQTFLSNTFKQCYRVMSPHSWLICWFAPEPWFEIVYRELNNAGFTTTRMCGIWTKGYGQTMQPGRYLANTYEMFFYAWKGQPSLNKPGRGNEFKFAPVSPNQKTHPTERPVELMKEIYETFVQHNSQVLIPFLGSGNGLIAAYELGMKAVGFELSKAYKDGFLVKLHNIGG